jgi:putative oxidoreductase
MNWQNNHAGEGFEFHILAITMLLVILIRGSGAFSVDRALVEKTR